MASNCHTLLARVLAFKVLDAHAGALDAIQNQVLPEHAAGRQTEGTSHV